MSLSFQGSPDLLNLLRQNSIVILQQVVLPMFVLGVAFSLLMVILSEWVGVVSDVLVPLLVSAAEIYLRIILAFDEAAIK